MLDQLDSIGDDLLHANLPGLVAALEWIAAGIDLLAIAVMLIGTLRFVGDILRAETAGEERLPRLDLGRVELGRYILSGLELFIVSDIIQTALSLALADLIFLGLLVAIRAVISYFLTQELRELRGREDP